MRRPVPTCPAPRVRETIPVLVALFLLAAAGVPGFAADDCEAVLRAAERSYRDGWLEEALEVREACLEGKATKAERVRAHALLAKVYLTGDEFDQARAEVVAAVGLDPDFSPSPEDPWRFVRLVAEVKQSRRRFSAGNVSTVSKADEPLREAPATVVVITADQIEQRGYLDLEELLYDLPGFDLSRGNGDVYSNVYMRGYRSDYSDRMLFLIDGVEQNDLHSNTVDLSRQYPLSNVAQVEVVYGPASTIYGTNAFIGVVSVTTKEPEALIAEGRNLGLNVQAGLGSFATRYLDATVAGRSRSGSLRWSLTGRRHRSDEQDLSAFDDWDYDFSELDDLDYQQAMRIEGELGGELARPCEDHPELCELVRENGEVVAVQPTAEGAALARQRDQELFAALREQGRTPEFSDETDDWGLDAKVQLQNLTFGVRTWRREEGTTPWYTDAWRAGSRSDNLRTPSQTGYYVRYSRPIGGDVSFSLSSRYKQHQTDSSVAHYVTYAGETLNLSDLLSGFHPYYRRIAFNQKSSQFRNELTFIYEPSRRFNLVSGIELRTSSVQLDFRSSIPEQIPATDLEDRTSFPTQITRAKTEVMALGLFAQASYRPIDNFKIVVGGRIDTDRMRNREESLIYDRAPTAERDDDLFARSFELTDFGPFFSPRLALVYTRDPFVFKAIYAGAYKEPTNFQRFSREPGVREHDHPDLDSERGRNFELGLSWQPREDLFVEFVAYEATYTHAVGLIQTGYGGRFENAGDYRIRGVHLNASLKYTNYGFFGNYTYTEPFNTDPVDHDVDKLRIGDIASHRLNLGVHMVFREKLNLNLRTNWVGERKTGPGTTVPDNPLDKIDSYLVAHATLGYEGFPAGTTWQLVVKNLFDAEYYHPGVQWAGWGFASRLPQPGRTIYLRFLYER